MQIEAKDVGARFGRNIVLRKINFTVHSGEMVGLIGPNGSGKTTLLRILANLRAPDGGGVFYGGKAAGDIGQRQLAQRVAYLAQGGDVHWQMRVETLIELGRLPHRRPMQGMTTEDRAAVDRAIAACDVEAFRERSVGEVSGGERLRILLARALAVDGDLLLADEPVSALDPLHQLQVMQLLRKTTHQSKGVVVVLHDLALAARFCDRLVLLTRGSILVDGRPDEVMTDANIANAYGVAVVRGEHQGIHVAVATNCRRLSRQMRRHAESCAPVSCSPEPMRPLTQIACSDCRVDHRTALRQIC
jgi:iron complex transport system ATP-binding protein